MKHPAAIALGTAWIASLLIGGCAASEHRRYRAADAEYRACLDDNPRNPDACEPLRAARDQAYQHYERAAERSWGCNWTPEGCGSDSLPDRTR